MSTYSIDIKVLKDLGETGTVHLENARRRPLFVGQEHLLWSRSGAGAPELQMSAGREIAGDRPPRYGPGRKKRGGQAPALRSLYARGGQAPALR